MISRQYTSFRTREWSTKAKPFQMLMGSFQQGRLFYEPDQKIFTQDELVIVAFVVNIRVSFTLLPLDQ